MSKCCEIWVLRRGCFVDVICWDLSAAFATRGGPQWMRGIWRQKTPAPVSSWSMPMYALGYWSYHRQCDPLKAFEPLNSLNQAMQHAVAAGGRIQSGMGKAWQGDCKLHPPFPKQWLIVAYCGLFLQCENSEKHVSTSILGRRHKMSMMRNGRRKPSSGRQRWRPTWNFPSGRPAGPPSPAVRAVDWSPCYTILTCVTGRFSLQNSWTCGPVSFFWTKFAIYE